MSINVNDKNIGHATAYAYYKAGGGTMTEAEFTEFMADFGTASQTAVEAAQAALASETAARNASTTATNKASEATTAAQTATSKAAEASTSASTATSAKDTAVSASQTATTKAGEATTAAATATSAATIATTAKDDAVSAKTAAQTAKTAAETAAASVAGSAAQIATNAADISQLKSDLTTFESDGVVPSAEQILTDKCVTDSVPYHFRPTGGGGADREYVDAIVGGTINFNQLARSIDTSEASGITYSYNQDGSYTVDGTATANAYRQITNNTIANHVFFYRAISSSDGVTCWRMGFAGDTAGNVGRISKQNSINGFAIRVANGTKVDNVNVKATVIDLTAMFGAEIADYIYNLEQSNAGTGVAFFKKLFPKDYYEYNAGELVSVSGLSEHKMVGFNQLNPTNYTKDSSSNYNVSEGGTLSTGGSAATVTGSNPIAIDITAGWCGVTFYADVLGGCQYQLTSSMSAPTSANIRATSYFVDDNGNVLNKIDNYSGVQTITKLLTPTVNCKFALAIESTSAQVVTVNDLCFHFSDPAKNGTYEPYEAHRYPLDNTLTLRGIPKLVDGKLTFDGDRYLPDGTIQRRYGVVDLGTLNWTYVAGSSAFVSDIVLTLIKQAGWRGLCSIYRIMTGSVAQIDDKSLSNGYGDGRIRIKDSSYSDATAFKTAMSGVMLVYELEEPVIEEAEPYAGIQACDDFGTEEFVSTGIVPVGHETRYPENLRAKIEGLPWDFSSLIAPTEKTNTASRNYTAGSLLIMGNVLYKVTANIANGGTITPNTNATATTLSEILSALAQ